MNGETDKYPIHDLYVVRLEVTESAGSIQWQVYRNTNHLLRRFGEAQVIRLLPAATAERRLREMADEVWALLEGKVEFEWHDQREGSPTSGSLFRLTCEEPTLVLVPFGVAFGVRAIDASALLARLMTHEEGEHEGDQGPPGLS